MNEPIVLIFIGFLLGLRHATDADHVVAVTAIVSRHQALGRVLGIGAMWGAGHTLTLLLAGGAIILLRLTVPPRLGLGLEFAVALMLIALGIINLAKGRPSERERPGWRSFMVGMVHGLAGSAAVALLVLTRVPGATWAGAYLLLFGLGTMLGMAVVSLAIALPSRFASGRVSNLDRYLRLGTGVLSIAVGVAIAHEVGVVNGLFTADPRWEPH